MISLLCPTRGRPGQCKRMIESVKDTSTNEVCVHLALSLADSREYEISDADLLTPDDMPTVFKWNLLAKGALLNPKAKLFMLCADDVYFDSDGWDYALIEHYSKLENKIHVYALQDSRDEKGTPHPIVTREYIEAMGYFLPPIFLHWYVDTWTVAIAKANNCFTHLTEHRLIHDKANDKGQPDETHSRIRKNGWHARDEYVNLTCQHFLATEKRRLCDYIENQRAL